jgi:hypothetical protein
VHRRDGVVRVRDRRQIVFVVVAALREVEGRVRHRSQTVGIVVGVNRGLVVLIRGGSPAARLQRSLRDHQHTICHAEELYFDHTGRPATDPILLARVRHIGIQPDGVTNSCPAQF